MRTQEKPTTGNLLCFSHLRWDFVFQRPQHLLTRFSKHTNVYFLEEPIFVDTEKSHFVLIEKSSKLTIITPHLSIGTSGEQVNEILEELLAKYLSGEELSDWAFWYYTPLALEFSRKFKPALIVFDCMDELSAFKFAPPTLKTLEKELLTRADVVFTGGYSLYEAKKNSHKNIWPVPSSIDKDHFHQARFDLKPPLDQADIEGFKLGFYGVIDERFDLDLIKRIAEKRPDWQIVLLGPVVKIDPDTLPQNPNIHYLGQKTYQELPQYLSGWDVALIPFAINESTLYISPTKTPEYLAAGKPVVSTPIRDVIMPYGAKNMVHIASDAQGFISAIENMFKNQSQQEWLEAVDHFLKDISWDISQEFMEKQMSIAVSERNPISIAS